MTGTQISPGVRWQTPVLLAGATGGGLTLWIALTTRWHWYVVWLVLAGLVTCVLYGFDKMAARRGWRRVPERSLWTMILLGGFLGGWAGQFGFRHKTRKWTFWVVLVFATLVHGALAWFLWHHRGFR